MASDLQGADPPPAEPHELVRGFEAELDRLEDAVERCRKTALVARALAIGGAGLLALAVLRPDGTVLVLGVAGILGGLVLTGSTRTTRQQLLARMEAVDATRTELIDRIAPSDAGPAVASEPRPAPVRASPARDPHPAGGA